MSEVCIVHLVWPPLGTAPLRRFLESYHRFVPDLGHRLLLLVKQSADDAALAAIGRCCAEYGAEATPIPDRGFDLSVYFSAARENREPYFCFLNSYSEILAPGWLEKLVRPHTDPAVGVTGATGSFESLPSRVGLLLRCQAAVEARALAASGPTPLGRLWGWTRRAKRWVRALPNRAALAVPYPLFPNAHLRTNAFLIARETMLKLDYQPETTKVDTLRFESGRRGMTRQLERLGLQTLVVGRDGTAYPPPRWPESRTFRIGEQENLLIADNRTREYMNWPPAERMLWSSVTWGRFREDTSAAGPPSQRR